MLLRLTAFMLLIPFATGLLGGGLGWNQNIGENIFENVVENILEEGRNILHICHFFYTTTI